MILDATTKVVRAVMSGAPATAQPEWNVSWADHNATAKTFTPGHDLGALTGDTPKVIVAAPTASVQRNVKGIWIYNADTANVDITVQVYNGTDVRRWVRALLQPSWALAWEYGGTWHVYDAEGIVQGAGGGGTGGTTINVEEVDGTPAYTGIGTIRFDQADGFVVSQPGAGIARVDATGVPAPDEEAQLLAWCGMGQGAV